MQLIRSAYDMNDWNRLIFNRNSIRLEPDILLFQDVFRNRRTGLNLSVFDDSFFNSPKLDQKWFDDLINPSKFMKSFLPMPTIPKEDQDWFDKDKEWLIQMWNNYLPITVVEIVHGHFKTFNF